MRPSLPQATIAHGNRPSRHAHRGLPQHRDSGVELSRSSESRGRETDSSSQEARCDVDQNRKEECPTSQSDGDWGHEQAGLVLASISSNRPSPEIAVWDKWNVPIFLTDPATGQRKTMTSQGVVELLLHRFYAQPSFNCIVVPNRKETLHRLRYGAILPHLLHTMIACAAASSLTTEPELLLWRSQVWHGASESVHRRLTVAGPPELELVQSLLLLSTNWSGGLLQIERINTFYTAIKLALSLQLQSGDHLYVSPGPRSARIMLFWSFYCTDKILAVMTKRQPVICRESHSVPLPSIEDIEAASGLPPNTTVAAWLQRLAFAYISLIQITECVQRQLLLPIHHGKIVSLDQIYRQILPIERLLESFCKEQRWLLGIVTELSPICRSLAEAVISQLHFTQLHLYLPTLQYEVNRQGKSQQPIRFSPLNDKSLSATIESAWHLVQQPVNGTRPDLSSLHQASSSTDSLLNGASLTFSRACVLVGLNVFRFLSTSWSDWDQGKGCIRFAPVRISGELLQEVDPTSQMQEQRVQQREPLQEASRNRETQSSTSSYEESRITRSQERSTAQSEVCEKNDEQSSSKKESLASLRRRLQPLHIVQPYRIAEVDRATPTTASATSSSSVLTSLAAAVTTPARVLFNDEPDRDGSRAQRKQHEKHDDHTVFATLNSHAMLTPIRPNLLHAVQGLEPSPEEAHQAAEVLA